MNEIMNRIRRWRSWRKYRRQFDACSGAAVAYREARLRAYYDNYDSVTGKPLHLT